MSAEGELWRTIADDYGPDYQRHLLEQYKLYVELMDRTAQRRQGANTFFLSINAALVAFAGMVTQFAGQCGLATVPYLWLLVVPLAGMTLCYIWYRQVRSYKDLNTGKFKIIHALEKRLPAALFGAEWECLGKGEDAKVYLPFTHIEIWVPWVFFVLNVLLIALILYTIHM